MRESREVWEKRVARWKDSGLPASAYARELGISAQALMQWSSRLARGKVKPSRAPRSEPSGPPVGQSPRR